MRIAIDGKQVTIPDADNFIARYEDMVTERVMEAVANQSYEPLFAKLAGCDDRARRDMVQWALRRQFMR